MKIINCPKCKKDIIAEDHSNINTIKCPYCNYVDYAYNFCSFHLHRNTKRQLIISDILAIISSSIEEINNKECDPTSLIYGLYNKCNYLTPMVICQLINMLLSQNDSPMQTWDNETLFVDYSPHQVSLYDIFSLNKKVEERIITYIEKQSEFQNNVESLVNDKADLDNRNSLLKYENLHLQEALTKKQEENEALKEKLRSLSNKAHL